MLKFAAICPHPPIILPSIGSPEDLKQVSKTIEAMKNLAKIFQKANPEIIIISSPHPDWGFNVPLFYLAQEFKGEIEYRLINLKSPEFYFEEGKNFYQSKIQNLKSNVAVIASGDLSHCLKEDGPYGFHPDGPKFDKDLIESLKKKDIEKILKLEKLYPQAGECGLRSFCFLLGILESSGLSWQPEILSYEGPFGVGYLVANFKI
jgi:aromatic ring-opening dioxygenase LigB subunit